MGRSVVKEPRYTHGSRGNRIISHIWTVGECAFIVAAFAALMAFVFVCEVFL